MSSQYTSTSKLNSFIFCEFCHTLNCIILKSTNATKYCGCIIIILQTLWRVVVEGLLKLPGGLSNPNHFNLLIHANK